MTEEDNSRHDFEDNESVVVPPKTSSSNPLKLQEEDLWPAERRLYDIFPNEEKYRGGTKQRSKRAMM